MAQQNNSTPVKRRTKIVATLGPATDEPKVLRDMFSSGLDVVRINFSHGGHEQVRKRVALVRDAAAAAQREIAILADLRGPKIRIEHFADGPIELQPDQSFTLDCDPDAPPGNQHGIGITYAGLTKDVSAGDRLLLDDGMLVLEVIGVDHQLIQCKVITGGTLSDRKGLNKQGGGLSVPGLAKHDLADIKLAAELELDFLAVSFPRHAEDMHAARRELDKYGSNAQLIAKIERTEAITNLEEITDASDALLVARGDLGVEIGDAQLPAIQKRIIKTALAHNRAVITATQMMQSMISSPLPTRAEVLDVANAVLDGTDAVMLSAETAVGNHPLKVIEAMHRVCLGAERHQDNAPPPKKPLNVRFERIDQAIAMAAMYTATNVPLSAIVALTESGSTAKWLSRVRSDVPIYAVSPLASTRRRIALYRNVFAIANTKLGNDINQLTQQALDTLIRKQLIGNGDRVLVTMGDRPGIRGGTNCMKLIQIGTDGATGTQTELIYQ